MIDFLYTMSVFSCWVAGALTFAAWAAHTPPNDFKIKVFRRAWAAAGLAPVIGLLPAIFAPHFEFGPISRATWTVALMLYYVALTTALVAQSANIPKSLLASAMLLMISSVASWLYS